MIQQIHGADVSVTDGNVVWRLWLAPIGESQHKPLGFWRNAWLQSAVNYSTLEKEPLAYYWALEETGHP